MLFLHGAVVQLLHYCFKLFCFEALKAHSFRDILSEEDVFFVDGGRVAYSMLLREQWEKHGMRVLGYCLMTNHIHLVATPAREDSLNLAVGRTHFLYTQSL